MDLRVRLREANIFAVRSAKEAVGLIFDMTGSSAVYRGRVIEQAFRDVSTAANYQLCGNRLHRDRLVLLNQRQRSRHPDNGPPVPLTTRLVS
jgi:hypothetical protein